MPNDEENPLTIESIRGHIDSLDRRIVELMVEREHWVLQAGQLKVNEEAVRDPARVEKVIDRVRAIATTAGGSPSVVENTYRAMIAAFINLELSEHQSGRS